MLIARSKWWIAVNYYSFHIGDYRRDTAHLTPIEHYIYRTLIDWYFLNETQIPKETQVVIRRLSLGSDMVPNLENVLNDFFVLGENGWRHRRIDSEICEYRNKAEVNRVNGKLGGRPKKPKKTQTVSERLANDNPTESESNPNQEPLTINHKPIKDISFDDFYSVYPKKVKKSDAEKAWQKIDYETKLLIIDDVKNRVLNDSAWIDKKYIPNPQAYLNGRRWKDEVTEINPAPALLEGERKYKALN